jgi:hypothetical protein
MDVRMGGGRLATVTLDPDTRMNVDGIAYPTHCSLTFWNEGDRDEITVFASREQLKAFGKKIVDEIERATS